MKKRLLVLFFSISVFSALSAQTLYSSSREVSRFNAGYGVNIPGKTRIPRVAFDDVSIANSDIGGKDSINITKVNVGIRRAPGAPATDVSVYYTPLDDTSTQLNTIIKIPPVLLGRVSLPANGNTLFTRVVSVGDGIATLLKMKTDTNAVYAGYHTCFIGVSLSDSSTANAISVTSGPAINKNYIILYDADSSVPRYSAGFNNFPATFYIELIGGSTVTLPITLTRFKGELSETGLNELTWTTEGESNSKGFELQRSVDGLNFEAIAFIPSKAKGNSSATINYYFTVQKPLPGDNYYRLRQVDFDGRYAYSTMLLVKNERSNVLRLARIYPNPAKSLLGLKFASPLNQNIDIIITDLQGKIYMRKTETLVEGVSNLSINVSSILPGTYYLKAAGEKNADPIIARFIKQ